MKKKKKKNVARLVFNRRACVNYPTSSFVLHPAPQSWLAECAELANGVPMFASVQGGADESERRAAAVAAAARNDVAGFSIGGGGLRLRSTAFCFCFFFNPPRWGGGGGDELFFEVIKFKEKYLCNN